MCCIVMLVVNVVMKLNVCVSCVVLNDSMISVSVKKFLRLSVCVCCVCS